MLQGEPRPFQASFVVARQIGGDAFGVRNRNHFEAGTTRVIDVVMPGFDTSLPLNGRYSSRSQRDWISCRWVRRDPPQAGTQHHNNARQARYVVWQYVGMVQISWIL
jgi:hypothetical protein